MEMLCEEDTVAIAHESIDLIKLKPDFVATANKSQRDFKNFNSSGLIPDKENNFTSPIKS